MLARPNRQGALVRILDRQTHHSDVLGRRLETDCGALLEDQSPSVEASRHGESSEPCAYDYDVPTLQTALRNQSSDRIRALA